MERKNLDCLIDNYPDFPSKGILFKDITPIFSDPLIYSRLIKEMSLLFEPDEFDALVAIDARGFLFGSAISLELKKPLILARKPGKLPGEVHEKQYKLEYGTNKLAIQKKSLEIGHNFLIIDDLLATGGTVNCVNQILNDAGKNVIGLSVLIELIDLKGRDKLPFKVKSILKY